MALKEVSDIEIYEKDGLGMLGFSRAQSAGFIEGISTICIFTQTPNIQYTKSSDEHLNEAWEKVGQMMNCSIKRYGKKYGKDERRRK